MRALQLHGRNDLQAVSIPVPAPGPDEVLVKTLITTICTSDLSDIAHNPFGIALPRVLGHEGAGLVAAVGSDVVDFALGERVLTHPVIPCHQCGNCQRGLGHLCSTMGHLGLDRDGTFAEYFCIRADRARLAPKTIDFRSASLLEPLAVCLEAVHRGRIQDADRVLVVGDGPFGIMMARLAAQRRPRQVMLAGRHPFRLRQAPGAIPILETPGIDMGAEILRVTQQEGVDVAILAAGNQVALDLCLSSLRARGRAVIFSAIPGRAAVDLFTVHVRELEILGACNDQDFLDAALALLADPGQNWGSLVTHQFPFEEWRRAVDLARAGRDEALKVALVFEENL